MLAADVGTLCRALNGNAAALPTSCVARRPPTTMHVMAQTKTWVSPLCAAASHAAFSASRGPAAHQVSSHGSVRA
eukprot:7022885-Alexandrium_andersonii.AAC.1